MGSKTVIKKDTGFVLVSVLWLLVIMVLAASAFSAWVDKSRNHAAERQQQINAQIRSRNVFSKVLYTYMTGEKGVAGVPWPALPGSENVLQELGFNRLEDFTGYATVVEVKSQTAAGFMRMDGRIWDVGGGVRVIVQDRGGLIGLSSLSRSSVFATLAGFAGKHFSAESLQHSLYDYQDHNDYRRVSGAEAHHYEKARQPSPMNGYLRSPLQLRAVMNWGEPLKSLPDARLLEMFKVEGGAFINANTASSDALTLVSANRLLAEQVAAESSKVPYKSIFDIPGDKSGGEDIPYSITLTGGLRFWWWHISHPTAQVYDVQFDPLLSGQSTRVLNWSTRVVLPDELAQGSAIEIDHPFFH